MRNENLKDAFTRNVGTTIYFANDIYDTQIGESVL